MKAVGYLKMDAFASHNSTAKLCIQTVGCAHCTGILKKQYFSDQDYLEGYLFLLVSFR